MGSTETTTGLPFLFSQFQDINGRSAAPLQDTPSVKYTYGACVTVQNVFNVWMSANLSSIVAQDDVYNTTCFHMDIKVPSYSIAIAIGEITHYGLHDRVVLVGEPASLPLAVQQLSNLPQLLGYVEEYIGIPYPYGVFKVLIVPGNFPYAGMENPLLTFYSTALLTETKAVIYEMIHFIALQWTGNLVTMSNWADFWLNEGFATFIERQVSARLYGIDYAKTEALVGNHSLIADMTEFGFASTFTTLHPVFEGKNPEFSRSSVPFEKGFQLLAYIQSLIGYGPMQKFIKYYVENNADKSINSFDMQRSFSNFVEETLTVADDVNALLKEIDWSDWKYVASFSPQGKLDFWTTNSQKSQQLALDYIALGGASSPSGYEQYRLWYSSL